MPCLKPLKGYRSRTVNPTGKRSITFNVQEGFHDLKVELACGQCRWCRLERSRQWAVRIMHEASQHQTNSFLTLTYSEEKIPPYGTLVKKDMQDFFKRLRKELEPKIRYFHCGEYGDRYGRPHYHVCLFGYNFPDKKLAEQRKGVEYYESQQLDRVWKNGISRIGELTFESAAYVARYILKKQLGKDSDRYYEFVDEQGEYQSLEREYVTMSRRPGIGKNWFQKYKNDVYPHDYVVIKRKNKYIKASPPKFYLGQLELTDPQTFDKVRASRLNKKEANKEDNTHARLLVKEEIIESRLSQLNRGYENA